MSKRGRGTLALVLGLLGSKLASADVTVQGECEVLDYVITRSPFTVSQPADLSFERARRTIVESADGARYGVLDGADCRVRPIDLGGAPAQTQSLFAVPTGRAIFFRDGWFLASDSAPLRKLTPPTNTWKDHAPILANDGNAIVWVGRDPKEPTKFFEGRGTHAVPHLIVQSLAGGADQIVLLPPGTLGNVEAVGPNGTMPRLLVFDAAAREVTLAVEGDAPGIRYLGVGLDGNVRWGALTIDGVPEGTGGPMNMRRVGSGWIAWGDYTNIHQQPLTVAWALAAGRGTHRASTPIAPAQHPKIDLVALSADEKYFAVSVGLATRMKLSHARIYVVRVRDQKIVWERAMANATFNGVAFLGTDRFAFSDYDKGRQRHVTRVLRLEEKP